MKNMVESMLCKNSIQVLTVKKGCLYEGEVRTGKMVGDVFTSAEAEIIKAYD
jgi:hypothetical protein